MASLSSPKLIPLCPFLGDCRIGVSDSRLNISANIEQNCDIFISKPKFGCCQFRKLKMSVSFNGSLNTFFLLTRQNKAILFDLQNLFLF